MRYLSFILFLLAIPFLSTAQDDPSTVAKTDAAAPKFDFYITKDKKANLADYKGKIVLITFFNTYSPPCKNEMPRIEKDIWQKYKNNPKFMLIAVDREEDWDKLIPFKQNRNLTFVITPDKDRKIYNLYATQYLPRSVVVDESGKIIYQSIGYQLKDFDTLTTVLGEKLQ